MSLLRKYACMLVMMAGIALPSLAQQNRFVYLQTDNKLPFYVKIGTVVYSSSAAGYLIIPKLTDKTYELQIGFPKNEFPEQRINLVVAGKDAGYLLKNFGEKGWGLFNFQTMGVEMASGKTTVNPAVTKSTDEFSRVLADVVNSPDIAQTRTSSKENNKPVEPPRGNETVPTTAAGVQPVNSVIRKLQDDVMEEGRRMVYLDGGDTILVMVPLAKKASLPLPAGKEEKKVAKEELQKTVDLEKEISGDPEPINTIHLNPACTKLATEADFLKLRKRMASRTNDFDMISDAMKSFKSRCYTTEQIRNLSVLFLSNQGKYSFFDASYDHVADRQEFISLREALTDDYFRTRFDAMIRK